MNVDDFHGFHFLPPSVRVPPSWLPLHTTSPVVATPELPGVVHPVAGTGTGLHHIPTADHALPLGISAT